MAQQFGGKPSHVPGIVLFLTLWILSLAFVAPVFVDFRRTGHLKLAGSPLEGVEAVVVATILVLIPVTMLALALQRIHRYFRDARRNGPPGE